MPAELRVPLATYRLQLGRDLTFDGAAGLVPYLAALGISDCYISPFFETSSENSHGYDVADHNRIRAELGGEAAFARFSEALRSHGLGLIIDLVPNHMGITGNRNAWWLDVLENGAASRYAHVFDIDWTPAKPELAGKVLLPVLGDQYGNVLERGELRLELRDGTFSVHYYDTVLPIAPRSYARILGHRLDELESALAPSHPSLLELKALIGWFAGLPAPGNPEPGRAPDKTPGVERLTALLRQSPGVRAFLDESIRRYNGTPDDPRSFDLLDELLSEQAYRVAFWGVAGEEINYRRFFDINNLAAIRTEDPDVFAETHRLVFDLIGSGRVTGLRIDHPDGLYAPAEYFRWLQRDCAQAGGTLPDTDRGFYIVAEKILSPGESLPRSWLVAGTTGYDFLNILNGVFVDRSQARAMEQLYARLIKQRPPFAEVVYESKRLVMQTLMASELNMLAHRLNSISEKHRSSRDFTLASLANALAEIVANFPVYRTYVGDGGDDPRSVSESDRDSIARAVAQAKRRTPLTSPSIYDWIQDILILRWPAWAGEDDRRERLEFAMRFQQITSPVTAKGYEDTALYRFNRLVSLNEVGADPSRFGTPVAEFHAAMLERRRTHPHSLSATSTHDTKRGEDVRARINVLSEIPDEWRRRVTLWQRMNRKHRSTVDGLPTPGANTEYLIYQTLVGAWPIGPERLRAYLMKAIHEAKSHTSWVNPNTRYGEAIARFSDAILDPARSAPFLDDFVAFQARIAHYGTFNSLAQALVKITAPGVPDFYQGSELWDLNLVDPDNRRPVDWRVRQGMLANLMEAAGPGSARGAFAGELVTKKEDGRVKLYVIHQALAYRRAHAALFRAGEYRSLAVQGPMAEHVLGFARIGTGEVSLTIVPRLLARRGLEATPLGASYWGRDTRVLVPPEAGTRLTNRLTGESLAPAGGGLSLADVFAAFPVALLVGEA